jgi:predicted regulator of Ras-like GTPase activity (Roadblock/LC7/MglB family)
MDEYLEVASDLSEPTETNGWSQNMDLAARKLEHQDEVLPERAPTHLKKLEQLGGFLGAAQVSMSGAVLALLPAAHCPVELDLRLFAASSSAVFGGEVAAIERLGLSQRVSEVVISLEDYYVLLKPAREEPDTFVFLLLDKSKANLAMTTLAIKGLELFA